MDSAIVSLTGENVCPIRFQRTMVCGRESAVPQQSQQEPGQELPLRLPLP